MGRIFLSLVLFYLHIIDNIISIFQIGKVEASRHQGTCPYGIHTAESRRSLGLCYLLWVWRLLPGARASHASQRVRVTLHAPGLLLPSWRCPWELGWPGQASWHWTRLAWMAHPWQGWLGPNPRSYSDRPPHRRSRNHGRQLFPPSLEHK